MNDNGTIWDDKNQDKENRMAGRTWLYYSIAIIFSIVVGAVIPSMWANGITPFVNCEASEYLIVEDIMALEDNIVYLNPRAITIPGHHWRGFFKRVTRYPKSLTFHYGPITTTFNDARVRGIKTHVIIDTPTDPNERLALHKKVGLYNIKTVWECVVNNCVKATGPLMSAQEYDTYNKAEFRHIVEGQIRNGLYKMEIYEGRTRIAKDEDGKSIKGAQSLFSLCYLRVRQFSITGTITLSAEYEQRKQAEMKKIDALIELAKKKKRVATAIALEHIKRREYIRDPNSFPDR